MVALEEDLVSGYAGWFVFTSDRMDVLGRVQGEGQYAYLSPTFPPRTLAQGTC